MYNLLLRWSPALGLLLILVTLTSTLAPGGPDSGHPQGALALRQIAHDYLTARCDTKSTIPPVVVRPDGSFFLPLGQHLDYDSVITFAAAALQRLDINRDYTLELEDCASGEVFLGGFWKAPTADTPGNTSSEIACGGRDQPVRCANLSLAFPSSPAQPLQGAAPWFLFGLGFLLLIIGPAWQWWKPKISPTPQPEATLPEADSDQLQLGMNCTFSMTTQRLEIGTTVHDLTYREAKLFSYLAAHANQVLERETIQEAVWGDEGIMVGRSLDVFISRLRKKLSGAEGVEIQTVHGVGYRLLG